MASPKTISYTARMKSQYSSDILPTLQKSLQLDNPHQVPKLEKIVISVGLGRGKDDKRLFAAATNTVAKISGQMPISIYAKKSIANFKIREGLSKIGIKTTLRDKRMYEFTDRLISVVLPRVRDFHGVAIKGFDSQGNYSLGLGDHSVFPELSFEETVIPHGLQVTFVIKSNSKKHSYELLKAFGMPFEKKELK